MDNGETTEWIVWISGQPWDQDGGTHGAMAIAMSTYTRILWVDPPASPISPGRKQRILVPALDQVTDRIMRLRPVALPAFSRPGIRLSTPRLMRAQINWAMRKLKSRPNAVVMMYLGGLLGGWGDDVTDVLYGTDDYVAGAELMQLSARYLRRQERRDLGKADVVVAISSELANRWADLGPTPVVIPNGCWPLSTDATNLPAKEWNLPAPVVGVIGRLSSRLDLDILETIADSGISLVLMGPLDQHWNLERFHELARKPSVRYIGPVSSLEVPAYLASVDVGLTPYTNSDFNRASFPLKSLEYLSVGLPVVVNDLPAHRWLRADLEKTVREEIADQILILAKDSEDYVAAIKQMAAHGREAADHRREFAGRHSWTSRAAQFADAVGIPQDRRA